MSKKIYAALVAVVVLVTFGFSGNVYGPYEPAVFWGFIGMSFLGQFVAVQVDANARDIESVVSPKKFSYWHLVKDNVLRTLSNLLLIAIGIRFYADWFDVPITDYKAFIMGFSLEGFVLVLKNRKLKVK